MRSASWGSAPGAGGVWARIFAAGQAGRRFLHAPGIATPPAGRQHHESKSYETQLSMRSSAAFPPSVNHPNVVKWLEMDRPSMDLKGLKSMFFHRPRILWLVLGAMLLVSV